jgi:hypothetical protein
LGTAAQIDAASNLWRFVRVSGRDAVTGEFVASRQNQDAAPKAT